MLKDKYAPIIRAALTPAATKKLMDNIAGYVDRNSDILMTLDLSKRYSFGDSDRRVLFDACHIDQAELEEDIAGSKNIYSSNRIQSNPFYIASMLCASDRVNRNDMNGAQMVISYMSLQMYVSQHKGFFKYDANKQVMDYTIGHLDSTFAIRQFPSIFAFIQDNTKTALDTYKTRIARCTDQDITWVIDSIWTRLKGKLKKIAQRFYENHRSGRYLNADSDSYDADDYHEMDNQSFAMDRLINKVYISLINRQYDKRFIRYSINSSETSYQKCCNLIEDIIDEDGETHAVRRMIGDVIEFYLTTSGKPMSYIAKGDFIAYMKTAFGSNTDSKQMKDMKNIIDGWLASHAVRYGRANYGKTVQLAYRRTLYMFFVFIVNHEAKIQ